VSLLELLDTVRDELIGCELTSVVNFDSGLSLASSTSVALDDAAAADAFQSELYRVAGEVLKESGLDESIDDLVLQGRTRILVSSPLGDSGFFWHVVTRSDTTLGYTQAVMRKYHQQVLDGVHALVVT